MHILFVCTGNTCRSPMAEVYAKKLIERYGLEGFAASSAGVMAVPDMPASQGAKEAMRRRGMDLSAHRARIAYGQVLEAADMVLCMSGTQLRALQGQVAPEKLDTLARFAGPGGNVADPYGGDQAAYERCADQIMALVEAAMQRLGNA